jgi:hypothetical protein
VLHCIRVMKTKLRNITITLEETLARWARIEAARNDTSVSRLLADLLRAQMTNEDQYERAMQEALAREPFLTSSGPYLTREEAHDRERLR